MQENPIPRRDFLKGVVAATAVSALASSRILKAEEERVIAVATWNHGVPAVEACGKIIAAGGSALDAVEQGARTAELDPKVMSVGYGGLPNAAGIVELDACIMDGRTRNAGAVAALTGCKTPISVARRVMELTPHLLLVGDGARRFATEHGFEDVNLLTAESLAAWERWRAERDAEVGGSGGAKSPADEEERKQRAPAIAPASDENHDTIGVLARDAAGHLAAACTTSGLAWKLPGRVGDSPIAGAGLYAEDGIGAATATGIGEEVIKICGSFLVVERLRAGDDPDRACQVAIERILARNPAAAKSQVAFLALRADGACGAAAIRPGFTYGLWLASGAQHIEVAPATAR